MTLLDKAKQLKICPFTQHNQNKKLFAERINHLGFDPMFYRSDMALAAAIDIIEKLQEKIEKDCAL